MVIPIVETKYAFAKSQNKSQKSQRPDKMQYSILTDRIYIFFENNRLFLIEQKGNKRGS